jgi:hypothetical protein
MMAEPEMEYEVLEGGEWVAVSSVFQCNGGNLRFVAIRG